MESESAARVKRIIIWDAAVSGSPRWLGWLNVVWAKAAQQPNPTVDEAGPDGGCARSQG